MLFSLFVRTSANSNLFGQPWDWNQEDESEHTESGMLTKSGSAHMPEGKKIVFNLSEDNVFQNRASDASSGTRRPPTH